jgi:endo-alpha-1,4-polygalactosaminidase (GH114 family)
MDSEKDETSVSKLKRMMVEQLRSLRRTSKKQVNIIKDNVDKQLDRAHKQLNVLKDNTNIQINLRKIPKRR